MFSYSKKKPITNFIDSKLKKYNGQRLTKRKKISVLFLYYLKVLIQPVLFNWVIVILIALSIYKQTDTWMILTLAFFLFGFPLFSFLPLVAVGVAYKKGAQDARDGKVYDNPYPTGTNQFVAYRSGYEEETVKK